VNKKFHSILSKAFSKSNRRRTNSWSLSKAQSRESLGYEDIVENTPALYEASLIRPDNTWEEGLQPPGEGFGQNFIDTP
jgi:hypothetical protein